MGSNYKLYYFWCTSHSNVDASTYVLILLMVCIVMLTSDMDRELDQSVSIVKLWIHVWT